MRLPSGAAAGRTGFVQPLGVRGPVGFCSAAGQVHRVAWSGEPTVSGEGGGGRGRMAWLEYLVGICSARGVFVALGFHLKGERVLGELLSSSHALESRMLWSFPRAAVVSSCRPGSAVRPQAPRGEAGTRRAGPLPREALGRGPFPPSQPWGSLPAGIPA